MVYKERISGIYFISRKDKPNEVYIGSSVNVYSRWGVHLCELRGNKHHCVRLQRLYNKYGLDMLDFRIVDLVPPEELLSKEQWYIDKHIEDLGRRWLLNSSVNASRVLDDPDVRDSVNAGIRLKWATDYEFRDRKTNWLRDQNSNPEFIEKRLFGIRKRWKPVVCVELNITFDNCSVASKFMLDTYGLQTPVSSINQCCLKKQRTAGGYNWRFLKDAPSEINKPHHKRKVELIELSLKFESIADARRYLQKNYNPKALGGHISACCLGKTRSAYGFTWRYL